jgi:fructose-1,6-bisphosphatase I
MDPSPTRSTLNHHILREQHGLRRQTRGEFSALLMQIAGACKRIGAECRRAGLGDAQGSTGAVGHHGDEVKRLDAFADEAFARAFDHTGLAAALVSEEMEKPYLPVPPGGEDSANGDYVVCIDPIDGSSNIEVDVTVGTIFSVQRRTAGSRAPGLKDLLRAGTHLEAAGYVLYGPACVLVLATGLGVDVCTQDPVTGEFLVTDTKVQIPPRGPAYSVNEANEGKWDEATRRLVGRLRSGGVGEMKTARYVGSLVADFHRTLMRGGLFGYPGEAKKPEGKIRLLYEAAPLAFVAEKAGGAASTGKGRILEVVPRDVHERTPIFIGGAEDVADAVRILAGK